ncbi:transposase [Streptomyces populi]
MIRSIHDQRDPVPGHRSLAVADVGHGDAAAFRHGPEERDPPCAVGASDRHTARSAEVRLVQPSCAGTGRPPKMQHSEPARTVKDLVIAAGRKAPRPVSRREGSRPGKPVSGPNRTHSRFAAPRIRPAGRRVRQAADSPEPSERRLPAE